MASLPAVTVWRMWSQIKICQQIHRFDQRTCSCHNLINKKIAVDSSQKVCIFKLDHRALHRKVKWTRTHLL